LLLLLLLTLLVIGGAMLGSVGGTGNCGNNGDTNSSSTWIPSSNNAFADDNTYNFNSAGSIKPAFIFTSISDNIIRNTHSNDIVDSATHHRAATETSLAVYQSYAAVDASTSPKMPLVWRNDMATRLAFETFLDSRIKGAPLWSPKGAACSCQNTTTTVTTSTLFFNEDVSAWDISAALGMFRNAATFEHNRRAWARLADPTVNNTDVFLVQAVLPARTDQC
jgi:hypothetical protein